MAMLGMVVSCRGDSAASNRKGVEPSSMLVYVGTYTGPKSQGIYAYQMDLGTGQLSPIGLAAEVKNPTFLAIHPDGKHVYAVSESWQANEKSILSAFSIDASGKLALLNEQPSGGKAPCHVAVDPSGKVALVANYGAGTVASLPIDADGKLGPAATVIQHAGKGPNAKRQEGPHAHSINPDAAGKFAFAADLGVDRIFVYQLDPDEATLTPNDPPATAVAPGAGPRHFTFHPNGRSAYVINELDNTVTAFSYDAKSGRLTQIQTLSTLPEEFKGQNTTAEVKVHPSGTFLYGSNRGHDSLAMYRINRDTGRLALIGHQSTGGKEPRNFNIDPTGRFLIAANQSSDNMLVFKIDLGTGRLTQIQEVKDIGAPVCVQFLARYE